MSTGPGEILWDLLQEDQELDSVVSGLAPSDWDRQTPAVGWAIRDQISHLAFFDEVAAVALRSPQRFAPIAEAAIEAMSSGADPMEVHLTRGRAMDPGELLGWWRTARQELADAASSADPSVRVPWFGPPMSTKSFLSARVMEVWAHGQDVADCIGLARTPTDRLRHVAHVGYMARGFSYAVRSREMPDEPVLVALTAPDGSSWEWGPRQAESTVSGPAVDFCLVVTRRRRISESGLLVRGDAAGEWLSIAQAFAGPPGPER
jgi:uncharacterized protein (TIGR03084 family)